LGGHLLAAALKAALEVQEALVALEETPMAAWPFLPAYLPTVLQLRQMLM